MHLHHVQVSMPAGREDEARAFYVGALGLREVAKPASLQGRGGCWFRAVDDAGGTTAEVHLGVDSPFIPAKKAHAAFVLESVAELEERARRISDAGFEVSWEERLTLEGFTRFHCRDGFGNRIEVLAQQTR